MAPIYFELTKSPKIQPVFLATAQHRQMLDQTLSVFGIKPDYDLDLMQPGQSLPSLTSSVLTSVSDWISREKPDAILVQGDTTTVLSSALAAFYARVPIGHVEAGLRTGNMQSPWPEEMNRRLTTPLVRWNFCPTEISRDNLLREGVLPDACRVTGNSVVDALLWMRGRLRDSGTSAAEVAGRVGIPAGFCERYLAAPGSRWILVTGHRRESFGDGFEQICHAINALTAEHKDIGILYPVHLNPQVQEPVRRLLGSNERVALVPPAAYGDFVWLMDHSTFILSDSGGVQEEAPSLGKPVLVMRDTTERPEGVVAGTSRLVGTAPEAILAESRLLLNDAAEYARRSTLRNPYGDGRTAIRIREILEREV
jgi:UDP-N-acetylglucosamine 2-epimerase (non-hydrolysing)